MGKNKDYEAILVGFYLNDLLSLGEEGLPGMRGVVVDFRHGQLRR